MERPRNLPKNLCVDCIQPCVTNDGECLGPITEEQARAKINAIVFDRKRSEAEKKGSGTGQGVERPVAGTRQGGA